jgi:hypothetical protein
MDSLGNILNADKAYQSIARHQEILRVLNKHWSDILGKLSTDIELLACKDHQMLMATHNPMWSQEIQFYKQTVLDKANQYLKEYGIKNRIQSLKIIHQSGEFKAERPQKNPQKSAYPTLQAAIHADIQDKMRKGWTLCTKCHAVYCKEDVCTFCRVEEPMFG